MLKKILCATVFVMVLALTAEVAAETSGFRGRFTMTYTTHGGFGNEYVHFRDNGTFSFTGISGTFTESGNTATLAMPGIEWVAELDGDTITINDPFSDVVMIFERD